MRCPFCRNDDTQVKDSRSSDDGAAIRRRRYCNKCESRFTTFERVQLRELNVIKKDGQIRAFDREKLLKSIGISIRKRPVTQEQVEQMVNNIVKKIEASGENQVESSYIGKLVMENLYKIDQVAYVRFASVYKQFREAKDFEKLIEELDLVYNNS